MAKTPREPDEGLILITWKGDDGVRYERPLSKEEQRRGLGPSDQKDKTFDSADGMQNQGDIRGSVQPRPTLQGTGDSRESSITESFLHS